MLQEEIRKISTLKRDDKNFNKGTYRGNNLLKRSLSRFGAARSILLDADGVIMAGNKSADAAEEIGINNVRIIESTGDVLVAVRRNDIDLDSLEGREMAIADNMVSKSNFSLDYDTVMECRDRLCMELENLGIKNLESKIKKEEDNKKKKKDHFVTFGKYRIPVTDDEQKRLDAFVCNYYETNGVLIGVIAEMFNL